MGRWVQHRPREIRDDGDQIGAGASLMIEGEGRR